MIYLVAIKNEPILGSELKDVIELFEKKDIKDYLNKYLLKKIWIG